MSKRCSSNMAQVFDSLEEARNYIHEEEIKTNCKFVFCKSRKCTKVSLKDLVSAKEVKIIFQDRRGRVHIPFCGMPFVKIKYEIYECCYGSLQQQSDILEPVTLAGKRALIEEIRKRPLEPDDKLVQAYVTISGEHKYHPEHAEFIATRLGPADISSVQESPAVEEDVQTDETIEEWLAIQGLKQYIDTFKEHQISTVQQLASITEEDLIKMEIKKTHTLKLWKKICILQNKMNQPPGSTRTLVAKNGHGLETNHQWSENYNDDYEDDDNELHMEQNSQCVVPKVCEVIPTI